MATLINHPLDTKQIVITIRMPRFFGARMWMTIKVLQLAGLIAPITFEMVIEDD